MSKSELSSIPIIVNEVGTESSTGVYDDLIITGMVLDGEKILCKRQYDYLGEGSTQTLTMPAPILQRVAEFFIKYYGDPEEPQESWNCHLFQGYTLGWLPSVISNEESQAVLESTASDPTQLAPYVGYTLLNSDHILHSILSLPDGKNMGVLGPRLPLAISDNNTMLNRYSAQAYHRTIFRF